ncbi:MAG: DUF4390 domain-containing protein [Desulfobacteraceae bacterium]
MKSIIVRLTTLMLASFFLFLNDAAFADEEPRLENIIVTNTRDNLLLYLTAKNAFPKKIVEAIQSGVPTTFTFYINLYSVRSLWLDKKITGIQLSHTVKYDTLKKEYIITRSWEGNRPLTVKTLTKAKTLMSEVDSLEIVPLQQLEKGRQYQIRAKAELDRLTLRFYLHHILFFLSFWDVETDWHTIDFIY